MGNIREIELFKRLWRGSQIYQKCIKYCKGNHSWNGWVCIFESSTLGLNLVYVIDRACSCLIVARLIKFTLTRSKMLPSRMAHHLTFPFSCGWYGRKTNRKFSEVMVFRDSKLSKEVCRPQYMRVMCCKELVILKVFA